MRVIFNAIGSECNKQGSVHKRVGKKLSSVKLIQSYVFLKSMESSTRDYWHWIVAILAGQSVSVQSKTSIVIGLFDHLAHITALFFITFPSLTVL